MNTKREHLLKEKVNSLEELNILASKIFKFIKLPALLLLQGSMGAGKTTLTQKLAKYLGVKEKINSPTFNYLNSYQTEDISIFHLDLYRLSGGESLGDFDFIDLIKGKELFAVFIEWPNKLHIDWRKLGYPVFEIQLRVIWNESSENFLYSPREVTLTKIS